MEQEIKYQKEYLQKAKDDLEAFNGLVEGVEQIASGFKKIATFLNAVNEGDSRIKMHQERIADLEKILSESQQ